MNDSRRFTEEELANMELVRMNIEGMSEHDLEKAVTPLADDVFVHDFGEPPKTNKNQVRRALQWYFDAFPDLRWTITNVFAKGEQVVLEGEGMGTRAENADGGRPGTKVQFHFAVIDEVRGGKIRNIHTYVCRTELSSEESET